MYWLFFCVSISVWTVLLLPTVLFAKDGTEQELLALVTTSNRAAVESIHSLYCRHSYNISGSKTPRASEVLYAEGASTEYWRSPRGIRQREQIRYPSGGETVHDILVQQGRYLAVEKQLSPGLKPHIRGAVRPAWEYADVVYWMALFKFFSSNGKNRPVFLHELLATRVSVSGVKKVKDRGRDLVYLDIRHGGDRDELWFDPQVNYLVCKDVHHSSRDKSRTEHQIVRFKEVAPGVYFPQETRSRFFLDGKPNGEVVHHFSDVRVNQPLPADAFELRWPAGIKVGDYVANKIYQVEADGRLTHLKDWQVVTGPLGPSLTANPAVTREEPKSLLRWLLPLGLLLLALGGLVLAWRRWKARSAPGY